MVFDSKDFAPCKIGPRALATKKTTTTKKKAIRFVSRRVSLF